MSSLYAKLIQVIEQKITPMAGAVGQQKYVTSSRIEVTYFRRRRAAEVCDLDS